MKRERLELTFGVKDADIWEYLEKTGLPKASLVKKFIRDQMEREDKGESAHSASVVTRKEEVATTPEIVEIVVPEEQPQKPSLFGNLAVRK